MTLAISEKANTRFALRELMPALTQTQIPKPADEQVFERASIHLWRCILKDPNVQKNGRRGQRQNGVDVIGVRNGDSNHLVGIQCKLKGEGKELTETEVRREVTKALTFKPPLKEYFISTTAPDDVAIQELARQITQELKKNGTELIVNVWGWNTLEDQISEHDKAIKAFDPSYGPFTEKIGKNTDDILADQAGLKKDVGSGFAHIYTKLEGLAASVENLPGDESKFREEIEKELDAEIDVLRDMALDGRVLSARSLLEKLLQRQKDKASGRILFRIKANLGCCELSNDNTEGAITWLDDAYNNAPEEPIAIANRVLSLLLQEDHNAAAEFGLKKLSKDPSNESLAGYFVQALLFDNNCNDPLEFVPEPIRESEPVLTSLIEFYRSRNTGEVWWKLATSAAEKFPSNDQIQLAAAEAVLEEILKSEHYNYSLEFKLEDKDRLSRAVATLGDAWDKARASDCGPREYQIAHCCNLCIGLNSLGDFAASFKRGKQGLEHAPDDQALLVQTAAAAIEINDRDYLDQVIERISNRRDAAVLRFRYLAQNGQWGEIAGLDPEEVEAAPDVEKPMVSAMWQTSKVRVGDPRQYVVELSRICNEVSDHPRACIVVAYAALDLGQSEVALSAYKTAHATINKNTHISVRTMVAGYAASQHFWADTAGLLDGFVETRFDNSELRKLATALVNEVPIRKRATDFFKELPDELAKSAFYAQAAGLLHFNQGDLPASEKHLRLAIEAEKSLTNYLTMLMVYRRAGKAEKIPELLHQIDRDQLNGSPVERMQLAQELARIGALQEAVELGYATLISTKNSPQVSLGYFGLIMAHPDEPMIPPVDTVDKDCWVNLTSLSSEVSFIIVSDREEQSESRFAESHPLAKACIGLKEGDSFTQEVQIGKPIEWTVSQLKHKYLHALHDVMENFQTRYPDAHGLYRFRIEGDDIGPMLDQIKKNAEDNVRLADLYSEKNIPIAMIASSSGGDVVGLNQYIASLGRDIVTNYGTEPERAAASRTIEQRRASGAVLDTQAAWTAATMNLFGVLSKVFDQIVVPQSVVDTLTLMKSTELHGGGKTMTVSYQDGQYFRNEFTDEDRQNMVDNIDAQIQSITENCTVLPASAPDEPSKLLRSVAEGFDPHIIDPAYLAADNRLLISQDMYYRQWMNAALGVEGVWLQSIVAFAREHEWISDTRFADAAVGFSVRRHTHVSLYPQTLIDVFEEDNDDSLEKYTILTREVGTLNADYRSHVKVVIQLLNYIWTSSGAIDTKQKKATSIVLRDLIKHSGKNWALLIALIERRSDPNLRSYIESWVKGHFLPFGELQAVRAEIATLSSRLAAN